MSSVSPPSTAKLVSQGALTYVRRLINVVLVAWRTVIDRRFCIITGIGISDSMLRSFTSLINSVHKCGQPRSSSVRLRKKKLHETESNTREFNSCASTSDYWANHRTVECKWKLGAQDLKSGLIVARDAKIRKNVPCHRWVLVL